MESPLFLDTYTPTLRRTIYLPIMCFQAPKQERSDGWMVGRPDTSLRQVTHARGCTCILGVMCVCVRAVHYGVHGEKLTQM